MGAIEGALNGKTDVFRLALWEAGGGSGGGVATLAGATAKRRGGLDCSGSQPANQGSRHSPAPESPHSNRCLAPWLAGWRTLDGRDHTVAIWLKTICLFFNQQNNSGHLQARTRHVESLLKRAAVASTPFPAGLGSPRALLPAQVRHQAHAGRDTVPWASTGGSCGRLPRASAGAPATASRSRGSRRRRRCSTRTAAARRRSATCVRCG
jgi:hypothetical protein